MKANYRWSMPDVLNLLNVGYNDQKEEQEIVCPFCGSKRFGVNIKKGIGHCWKCGGSCDSASFYAAMQGISVRDARNEIEERLGLKDGPKTPIVRPERVVFREEPETPLAPIEVRDKTYRAFLEELSLNQKETDNLLARGFSPEDIVQLGYKTYPAYGEVNYNDLCRRLLKQGCTLEGVPGFFKDQNGNWTIPRYTQGILIPQLDTKNRISGFQIRKDDDLRRQRESDGELEPKCVWFSSKGRKCGTSAKTSVHCSMDFVWDKEQKEYRPNLHGGKVTLTEGGMKADLCACLLDGKVNMIAVPGVQAYSALKDTLMELKKYGLHTVNLAFDMDYLTNENVEKAMKKVKKIIVEECKLACDNIMNWQYEVKENGTTFYLKGIDDYFAYQQKHIIPHIAK